MPQGGESSRCAGYTASGSSASFHAAGCPYRLAPAGCPGGSTAPFAPKSAGYTAHSRSAAPAPAQPTQPAPAQSPYGGLARAERQKINETVTNHHSSFVVGRSSLRSAI